MSSSSPDPSSSLNTTCFPWRNTVRFPEKPSTFCTFTTPSSRSWPSHCRCSSWGSSLQGEGLGRHWGWRGMLRSSSGSSLIILPPKESGDSSSGTAESACCALLSSPDWCSLSFLLFFFFSLSAFLWSSGCRVVIACCRENAACLSKLQQNCALLYMHERLMMWHQFSLHLFWCDWTAWVLAVDVSCFCPGGPS